MKPFGRERKADREDDAKAPGSPSHRQNYAIILDKGLLLRPNLLRCVLAQELGHLKSTMQRSAKS